MLLINPTRQELNRQAIKEDDAKLALEESFSRDLRVLFRRILKDLKTSFDRVGLVPDQSQYFDIMRDIIAKHQVKTAEVFSGTLRDEELKSIRFFERKAPAVEFENPEDEENVENRVSAEMAVWIEGQSGSQTDIVLETNTREIQNALVGAREELLQGDKIFGNKEIMALALIKLQNSFNNRSDLISTQNVLSTSNQSKLFESEAINDSSATIGGVAIAALAVKTWNAVLDSRTRAAHAQADFTYNANPIPVIEPFIVGGEALQYPGDPNGSPGNIINCRCSMQTKIVA